MYKLKNWAKFEDGLVVYDKDVYAFIKKHSTIIDRLNPKKMIDMYNIAFDMLSGSVSMPKEKKWHLLKIKIK